MDIYTENEIIIKLKNNVIFIVKLSLNQLHQLNYKNILSLSKGKCVYKCVYKYYNLNIRIQNNYN